MAASIALRPLQRKFTASTLRATFASFGIRGGSSSLVHQSKSRDNEVLVPTAVSHHGRTDQKQLKIVQTGQKLDCESICGTFSKLSLSPAEVNLTKEYVLPSISVSYPSVAILDPFTHVQIRDCPTGILREIIERPLSQNEAQIENPSSRPVVEKYAKKILKIRRKKMKKHQYRKWKKRNKFKLRAMMAKRRKKKQKLWEEHLDKYRYKGLTSEYIDWYHGKKKEEAAIFLNHLGILLEEETPESLEKKEKLQKLREKKITSMNDPKGSWKVYPTPILPDGSSLKRVLEKQERDAQERKTKLTEKG